MQEIGRHHRQESRNPYLRDLGAAIGSGTTLAQRRLELIELLTKHESYETAVDEIERSIDALAHLHREAQYIRQVVVGSLAVYLPINLPLYSLVLFAAIPSLMADRVEVRAPAATPEWVRDVFEKSGLADHFPRVRLRAATRRQFNDEVVSNADVVVFTGRYENAELVRKSCPKALFIFEGSGSNPVVVGQGTQIREDLHRITRPRLFNSGQDCAGPDSFLVHSSLLDVFVEEVGQLLSHLEVAEEYDMNVRIGPILNRAPLDDLQHHLSSVSTSIVHGGNVDMISGLVEPTVIVRPIRDHFHDVEYFAPIFNVLEFGEDDELERWFSRSEYRDRAMYASFFGHPGLPSVLDTSTVLLDKTILDVEQGNTAYGGYGPQANYVSRGEETVFVGPLLISEVLARYGQPTCLT